jgi:DNA polymerase (family 10)
MEINSNPRRLDLSDVQARRALELGVKLAVNTDAHAVDDLAYLRYGVATAQRGWVSAESVVNTWPLDRFLAYVRRHDG